MGNWIHDTYLFTLTERVGKCAGGMEHLREIKPRCHGGDGLQPTGARRWKLPELVAEQFAATRPFFLIPFITTCFSHSNKSSPNV